MDEQTTSRSTTIILFTITGVLTCVCGVLVSWRLIDRQIRSVKPTQSQVAELALLATEMPPPTATATPTLGSLYLPLINIFPTLTPTPIPDVIILAPTIYLLEGPGLNYPVVGQVSQTVPLYVSAQQQHCIWLNVITPSQLTGWILNDSAAVYAQKPCDFVPLGIFRPLTGVLKPFTSSGYGELEIDNGTNYDGVLILTISGSSEVVAVIYIRAKEMYTLSNIPDGTYSKYFTTGSAWNGEEFTKDIATLRFEKDTEFVTTYTYTNITYISGNISFQPVFGGTGKTIDVPPDEFPSIK